jgi:hypothetical protein
MLFLDNFQEKSILLIALIFFAAGTIYTLFNGEISFPSFIYSMGQITLNYWPIVIIAVGIILIIHREK